MNKHGLFYKMIQYVIFTRVNSISDVCKLSYMVIISLVINTSAHGSVIVGEHVYWLGDILIWEVNIFEIKIFDGFGMEWFCNWMK